MKKKIVVLGHILLLVVFVDAVSFWDRVSSTRQKNSVPENNFSLKANRLPGALLHWDSEISPNGLYQGDSYTGDYADYYNYYRVFVTNLENGRKDEVYKGDFRTLGWQWTDDGKIKIEWNCGTGCLASKVFGVDEQVSIADYIGEGAMNLANGWKVNFSKSF